MIKPQNYDSVETFKSFEKLEIGGHICVIKKVEKVTSKTGKPMMQIYLDTDKSDKQPNYYMESYKTDTRENKKWGCIHRIILDESEMNVRNLKAFNEAVQGSNNNFEIDWNNYDKQFTGKIVCGVFRNEEYENMQGEAKMAVKVYSFRTVDDLKNGKIAVPKDKLLNNRSNDELVAVSSEVMPF
ncbi:hypothetical protein [uncultured Clostridium sp.]|uniref:hypothetical protein n=1 Tax=uncultured Clostridium sp. TaxID=59620 RepID=UPI0025CF9B2E|nr:hypothetical protein [uncultured Clostridium sp.]